MKEQMERCALGDGVCGICQQPLSGQHWERWLPCRDAVHKSCAIRQRRAESLCPCCRNNGKAQDGLRVQSPDPVLLPSKNSEPADSDQRTHGDGGGNGRRWPCNGPSEGIASASIDACKDTSPLSRLVTCPLCCIRLEYGDPQPCVFCILKPQLLKLVHVAQQENAVGHNLYAPRRCSYDRKRVPCHRECLVRSVRKIQSTNDDDGKATYGSLLELFEPRCPDERSKILNYKASTCVNPMQDIGVWWSVERRVEKSQEERSEATRRGAIRRRVQRRARARRRRSRQATALGRRSAEEVGAEGTRGAGEGETTPESHDEESTTYGLPALEAEGDGSEAAGNRAGNAPTTLDDNDQVSEEIVEEEDPEGGQEHQDDRTIQDEQDAEDDETDSDPDYAEPQGFESGAILDDEESIAPVTTISTRRFVDIENCDYDEDTASDGSDTTLDNGHNHNEPEDESLEILRPEDSRGGTHVDRAGSGTHTVRSNARSNVSFWTNSHSLWSNLCARVRGCLPPCWRQSVQAVRNRLHQVSRPLEDIQRGHERDYFSDDQNGQQMGTALDDFPTRPETRRVRRRLTR